MYNVLGRTYSKRYTPKWHNRCSALINPFITGIVMANHNLFRNYTEERSGLPWFQSTSRGLVS